VNARRNVPSVDGARDPAAQQPARAPRSTSSSFINRTDELALVEAEHRDHAVVEQVITDLKDPARALRRTQGGMARGPAVRRGLRNTAAMIA
jgi:hypothetical protein